MIRDEILQLLRSDQAFREEVRRQLLTEELLALPARFDQLTELVREVVEAVHNLTQAQRRTEDALRETQLELRELVTWQRGEAGRRDGEQYEREIVRRAFVLFNGGQGGSPE